MFVTIDIRAAWRSNLRKRKAMLVSRIKIEKMFYAAKPLDNPLGVIDAVHAHAKQATLDSQLTAQRGAFFARVPSFVSFMPVFRERHADGIRPHARNVPLPVD